MKFKIGFLVGSLLLSHSVLFCAEGEANNFNQEKITQLKTWYSNYVKDLSKHHKHLGRGNQRDVGILNEMPVSEFCERATMSMIIGEDINIEYVYDIEDFLKNPNWIYFIEKDDQWYIPNYRKISSVTIGFLWPIFGYKIPEKANKEQVEKGKKIFRNIYESKSEIQPIEGMELPVKHLNGLFVLFKDWYKPENEEYSEPEIQKYRDRKLAIETEKLILEQQKQKEAAEKEAKLHPNRQNLRAARLAALENRGVLKK